MELFRLLQERNIKYLRVGGLAMLTYVQGALLEVLKSHILESDLRELKKFIDEEQGRRKRMGEAPGD